MPSHTLKSLSIISRHSFTRYKIYQIEEFPLGGQFTLKRGRVFIRQFGKIKGEQAQAGKELFQLFHELLAILL